MGTVSPNQRFSLHKLIRIRDNNYYDRTTKKDYVAEEVDSIIRKRQNELTEKAHRKHLRELAAQEEFFDKQLKVKRCATCKEKLPFDRFSPDDTKVSFGLKSSCKDCRNKSKKRFNILND